MSWSTSYLKKKKTCLESDASYVSLCWTHGVERCAACVGAVMIIWVGCSCVKALWAQREQSADPALELEESLQSGIDGIVGAHLSLSCIGAIPHRYYWFSGETSSITERLWPDEPGSTAEQRHSSLVMLYHQVNFRSSEYLKDVLFFVIHIPLVVLNEHFAILLRTLICLYWSLQLRVKLFSFLSFAEKYWRTGIFFQTYIHYVSSKK